MIKNVSIAVLLMLTLFFGVFAYMKSNEAVMQKQVAEQAMAIAKEAEAKALLTMREAEMQRELALKALENCN